VVNPKDVEMLEELVLAAVNQAREKAEKLQQEGLSGLTAGLPIPGLKF
jgi:DNA-binding protein YbaB